MSDPPSLISLYNLLARASNVSCSKGASAFFSLLTTEDDRLSLAIDGFIPALQNTDLQIPQRILAAYVLNALYVSHDHPNPFHDHLLRIFESERTTAIATSLMKSSFIGSSPRVLRSPLDRSATQAENEQLVWVLWKILQGEGDHLASYSPLALSRTTIPDFLQPLHLVVRDGSERRNINPRRPTSELPQQHSLGSMSFPTSQNSTTLFETGNPSSVPGLSRTPPASRSVTHRMPSPFGFAPFDIASSGSSGTHPQKVSEGKDNRSDRWLQQAAPKEPLKNEPRYQRSPDLSGVAYGDTNWSAFSDSMHVEGQARMGRTPHDQPSQTIGDQRPQTMRRTRLEESFTQNNRDSLLGGMVGIYNRPTMNQNGNSTNLFHETGRVEPQLQHSTLISPRVSTQSNVQRPAQIYLKNDDSPSESVSSATSVISDPRSNARSQLDPISRPHPRALSSRSASLDDPASTPSSSEISSVDGRPRSDVAEYTHELAQGTVIRTNNLMGQAPGIPLTRQKRTPTPTKVSLPNRSPGVIGSGRPSASISKSDSPGDHSNLASRWSQLGVIGNGRPEPSAMVRDGLQSNGGLDARREHESMIPFSVLRMRSTKEESGRGAPGVIGQSNGGIGDRRAGKTDRQTALLENLTALSIERGPRELFQEPNTAPVGATTRAPGGNWLSNPSSVESIPARGPAVSLQRQVPPLQPSAPAFQPQSIGTPVSTEHDMRNQAATVSPSQPAPASEHGEPRQSVESLPSPPFYVSARDETSETHINERERDELSHAIVLLLSARERVLTLTEQRMLQRHLPMLTQPLSLLRPGDIPPLVAKNTDIAAKLLLLLLDRKDEDAERIERVLKDATKSDLFILKSGSLDDASSLPATASIDPMAAVNTIQTAVRFVGTCGAPSTSVGSTDISPFGGREAKEGYLDALRTLPPTMQSFNLIARLLRPTHHSGAASAQQENTPEVRVAVLIRSEVLGGFMSGCVLWIEHAEQEEKNGEVLDDRVAIAVSSLCRFYSSLLKHGFVSAASEADTTEIMGFALRFSRFEEARSLYSILAAART